MSDINPVLVSSIYEAEIDHKVFDSYDLGMIEFQYKFKERFPEPEIIECSWSENSWYVKWLLHTRK